MKPGISLALGAALIALATALVPPTARTQDAPARTEAELRQLLAGAWFLTGSPSAGQATIDAAIERAVSEMNFFVQGVTRSQLRDKTPLNRRIDIAFAPSGEITVGFDQRFTYTTRPGVAQPFTLPDGAQVEVTQHFREGHLEQYFGHSLGRRWNAYALSPDGRTMTITATQQGPMMPQPVHFTLHYRQRGSAAQ
ncbi:MAG: hypothetical protein M3Y87_05625 [Myxococcota bacterium]|nr:hypothetical protein [Myxococcota bacterium]